MSARLSRSLEGSDSILSTIWVGRSVPRIQGTLLGGQNLHQFLTDVYEKCFFQSIDRAIDVYNSGLCLDFIDILGG